MSFNTTDTGSLVSAACDTSGDTAKNAQNEITEPIDRYGKTDTTNRDNDKHEGESEGTVWKRGNRTSRNGTRSQGPHDSIHPRGQLIRPSKGRKTCAGSITKPGDTN